MAQLSPSYQIRIPGSSEKSVISFKVEKRGLSYRLLRVLLVLVVVATFVGNVIFILAALAEMRNQSSEEKGLNVKTRGKGSHPESPGVLEPSEDLVIHLEVLSSKSNVSMKVNGKKVNDAKNFIGIYVAVLNQGSGVRMASSAFDTFSDPKYSDVLVQFLNDVTPGRIILFAVKDEASRSLKNNVRNLIKSYGSTYINLLKWRDMWAFAVQKRKHGGRVLAEGYQKNSNPYIWASDVTISTSFLASKSSGNNCNWKESASSRRRKEFCEKYEVYPSICRCENPVNIAFNNPPFPDGSKSQLPVAIIAGNRPRYLLRMLQTLQKVIGLDASRVSLFIDGFFDEPASVGKLFNIKVYQHESVGVRNARISQHYKKSLTTSFDNNPTSQFLVILEEDLDVSADILNFFQQLLPVLDKDTSLFCISAWNDQGYKHTAYDPSLTYRVEYMPGLGWVLPRKIYKEELEPNWPTPDKLWDWDMWVRGRMLKQRECIIPDISRTYHFGDMGLNVNPYFQSIYFKRRSFNTAPPMKLNHDVMYKDEYEKEMRKLIRLASVLDHSKTPCSHPDSFVPYTRNKTYVYYMKMTAWNDNKNWLNAATCLKIWDIDVRGYHKGLFRLWINGNHLMMVGCPDSPYCELKPSHITPVDIPKKQAKKTNTPNQS